MESMGWVAAALAVLALAVLVASRSGAPRAGGRRTRGSADAPLMATGATGSTHACVDAGDGGGCGDGGGGGD